MSLSYPGGPQSPGVRPTEVQPAPVGSGVRTQSQKPDVGLCRPVSNHSDPAGHSCCTSQGIQSPPSHSSNHLVAVSWCEAEGLLFSLPRPAVSRSRRVLWRGVELWGASRLFTSETRTRISLKCQTMTSCHHKDPLKVFLDVFGCAYAFLETALT